MLRPFPIGNLQYIRAVGSSEASGVEDGLGELTVLFGVGVAEAAGPHEVKRTRTDAATTAAPAERNYSLNRNAPVAPIPGPEQSARISARRTVSRARIVKTSRALSG